VRFDFCGELSDNIQNLFPTFVMTALIVGSACHKACTYRGQHNTEEDGQTCMSQVGFKPMIPVFKRP
jgi:hypothetical protein